MLHYHKSLIHDCCPGCQVIMHDEGHLAHLAALFNDSRYADIVLVAEAPHAEEDVDSDISDCSSCGSSGSYCGERESPRPERRRFHCHRAILASRSTYFDRMFGSGAAHGPFPCAYLSLAGTRS